MSTTPPHHTPRHGAVPDRTGGAADALIRPRIGHMLVQAATTLLARPGLLGWLGPRTAKEAAAEGGYIG